MKWLLLLSTSLATALAGCAGIERRELDRPKPAPAKREIALAEDLIRLLYLPERARFSLRYSPSERYGPSTATDLRNRVREIREAKGNVAFSIKNSGVQGETLTELKGIFDRSQNVFRYNVGEREHFQQSALVWIQFLANSDDGETDIAFTEVRDPLTAEFFTTARGSRQFEMTMTAPYLVH
jgi:hypothetical protein